MSGRRASTSPAAGTATCSCRVTGRSPRLAGGSGSRRTGSPPAAKRPAPCDGRAADVIAAPSPRLILMTSPTFDTVAGIISETCDIPRDKITPESHAINDLGIDSLDFLDKAFGIKMPLEKWTQEVNEGKVSSDRYFIMKYLCENIDQLVAEKPA